MRDSPEVSDPSGGYDDREFVAAFYDHVVPYRERRDIGFWVGMAREAGGPVLELGCGTGRVLIPTARAGVDIVGLDLSERMLAVCRDNLSREPSPVRSRVELVKADMRAFDLGRRFPLVTTPFRAFQHLLTVEDQVSCLERVRGHLLPGGRLVLDLYNPWLERLVEEKYLGETDEEPEFTMPDGRRVVRRARTVSRDLFRQVLDIELIYYVTHPDGRQERLVHAFPMRYFFRFEVEHLLSRCGFHVDQVYADFDKSAFGSTYPGELIFVARRGDA